MSINNNEFPQYITLIDTIIGEAGAVLTFNPNTEMYEHLSVDEDTDGISYDGTRLLTITVSPTLIERGYGTIFGVFEVESELSDDENSECNECVEECDIYPLDRRVSDLEAEMLEVLVKINDLEDELSKSKPKNPSNE